jgi:ubiquinone/menaquinone biosynthesis C-methylase UbiE
MGRSINLLRNYPKSKRDLKKRLNNKSEKVRKIARKFGKEFFDGDRSFGYGGFSYNKKYWLNVIKDFKKFYKLSSTSKVLDVGCAKGFMLYDFRKKIKGITIRGVDISSYAINNSKQGVKKYLKVANAKKLPFRDNEFDLVISINTIHNLNKKDCGVALREIERVSKKNSFITVDAYSNIKEKKRMFAWNLTAKTILSKKQWINFFKKNNYTGDYYWFVP